MCKSIPTHKHENPLLTTLSLSVKFWMKLEHHTGVKVGSAYVNPHKIPWVWNDPRAVATSNTITQHKELDVFQSGSQAFNRQHNPQKRKTCIPMIPA
jgi:hypothetical protein